MKVRLVSSIAVACCLVYPLQWLAAEKEIKYPSPDGRFALRITQSKDDEYRPTVELIEKHSSTVLVTLHSGQSDTDLFDASEVVLVWSADSKRVAYGFRANPPGALESNAATFAPLDRSMAREKKKLKLPPEDRGWPIMTSCQVRKWIDSSTALLYAHSERIFEIKNETESVSASFFFTLKFDAVGKWEMVRTREVPPKGVGGLNAEERKEINRIEKEDRELRSK
jgi:hypothetical protein